MDKLLTAYNKISSMKTNSFGLFYKTCFHMHTPASHDYKLFSAWDESKYKKQTSHDILAICIEYKVLPPDFDITSLPAEYLDYFVDDKEFLSYLLIANELIRREIAIAVVADHNTINGVEKLKIAIKQLCAYKPHSIYPEVILGIEITCADKLHVVGLFENTDAIRAQINNWLDAHLFDEINGSFETSKSVLNFIEELGGVGYIAHLNSTDFFKEKFLSIAYRKNLFEKQQLIGISTESAIGTVSEQISKYTNNKIKYILDNDSHCIEDININCMWVVCQKRTFAAINEAIIDYDVCISFDNPNSDKQYIKGMYISPRSNAFLHGKADSDAFCITFSDELNCFIGGRGTGKSTVLELIEYSLTQRCKSKESLRFLCAHGNTYVLYIYENKEYLVEMRMPRQLAQGEDILQRFGQNPANRYYYKYNYSPEEIRKISLKNYVDVFLCTKCDGEIKFEKVKNKSAILNNFFDTRYSVNELVNTASNEAITQFLFHVLFENKTLASPQNIIRCKSVSGLTKLLVDVQATLEKRRKEVESIIVPFNESQAGILRIVYSQNGLYNEPPIFKWLWDIEPEPQKMFCIGKNKYNITNENIEHFLLDVCFSLGICPFLQCVCEKDHKKILRCRNLLDYCEVISTELIEDSVTEIRADNVISIINSICQNLISKSNLNSILAYLKSYVIDIEVFSLEFNVNNKESMSKEKVKYQDVRSLSLGQKVVAMLSFILSYCDYSNDHRPLVIDQPEDNLDNQYIHKNLVKQLRESKKKRQVIIATHNATIVTNTKAEQVCVMESDGQHGWIKARGFTGEKGIKKNILNYLEGGKESFKHKITIYKDVLE